MNGVLIWRKHVMQWKHMPFKSPKDLTLHPHFEITATDSEKRESVTFNDIVINDPKLKGIKDITKLPVEVQQTILDQVADALENSPKGAKK